jgi:hypothetical protein
MASEPVTITLIGMDLQPCGSVDFDKDIVGATRLDTITVTGTFDDGPSASSFVDFSPIPRCLDIVQSRRFLWWRVCRSTTKMRVVVDWNTPTHDELTGDALYSVELRPLEAVTITFAPWWERALYWVSGAWSK